MRTIVVRDNMRIPLGKQGENNAVRVVWAEIAEKYAKLYGDGRFELVVVQKGKAYPAVVNVDGTDLVWDVLAADVATAEAGSLELIYYVGDTIAKSQTWETLVVASKSADGMTEPPEDPARAWFDVIKRQIGDLNKLTTKAKENLVAAINEAAKTGSGGGGTVEMRVDGGYIQYSTDSVTWENLIAVADLEGKPGKDGAPGKDGIPGKDGADGAPGRDGFSPSASVAETSTGATITITDKTGTTTAEIKNGKDGAPGKAGTNGKDGEPGKDGHTPKIAATKTGKTTSITADGVEIAQIKDGEDAAADPSLGITGAQAGQIAKITAVDTDGKPTKWEPVEMAGGDETWEKIAEIVIPEGADEANALTINEDFDGNPFRLVKARLCAKFPKYTGATTIPNFSFAMLNGKTSGRVVPLAYTSVWPKVSASIITGTVYEIDVSGAQQIEHVIKSGTGGWSDDSSRDYVMYGTPYDSDATWFGDTLWAKPITSIGGTGMLIYPGCRFVLYGVRA